MGGGAPANSTDHTDPFEILAALQAAAAAPRSAPTGLARAAQGAWAFAIGALACVLIAGWSTRFLASNLPGYILILLLLAALARAFGVGRLRASVAFVFLVLIGQCALGPLKSSLHIERNFYGVLRVVDDRQAQLHTLHHGTTVHGRQSLEPGQRGVPLAYFGREGPAGQVFAALRRAGGPRRVAVVGLGVGSLAAYARPKQSWEFYEIDPATERIARDPALFSFLADAAVPIQVILGDARLTLTARSEKVFDLLVLDAFSSDAIPVHLLTREAIGLYFLRLAPHGLLIANISNRFLDLEPIFAAHARERGHFARVRRDLQPSQTSRNAGITASIWVAVGRDRKALAGLDEDDRWKELRRNDAPAWTDDHASVFAALRFSR